MIPGDGAAGTGSAVRPLTRCEAARAELACLAEFACFVRRHRRYALVFAAIYAHSLRAWRRLRGVRVAFCLAQRLDDVLDGDRASAEPPLAVAARVRAQVATGRFGNDREGLLARATVLELDARARPGESPRDWFLALVDVLCEDRRRLDARLILGRAALDAHLGATFTLSLDLHLVLVASRLRVRDLPGVERCFAACSVLRDLDDDLAHGIVNVPREVLDACGLAAAPERSDGLRARAPFGDWVREEVRASLATLDGVEASLRAWPDRTDPGLRLLAIFTRSMRDFFARRVWRLYPGLRTTESRSAPAG